MGTATIQLNNDGDNQLIEGVLGSISSVGMGLYAHNSIGTNKQV